MLEQVHNEDLPINELNQPEKGNSLSRDAWNRLKKNHMAMAGLLLVIVYTILSVAAPILPIYSYKRIISYHQDLPPSLTKTAGELWYEKELKSIQVKADREGRSVSTEEEAWLREIGEKIETETMEYRGKTIKTHQRRYLLGTDYHGRDMLARIIYGGQISIAIG